MKKALGIVRVSSAEQAKEERYSIPHQKTHIAEECRQRGLDLIHYLEFVQSGDKVMSSTGKERDQVMKSIRDYDVDVVIVHELDRLARTALDTLMFVDELDKRGVSFISIHDGFDTTTAQGRLQMQILAAFAEYFRKQLASKVLGGLVERAKKGLPMGRRPFGRDITPTGFKINQEEAKVIKLMVNLYLEENLGHRSIAEKLNNMGYRTQTGSHWSHQAIKDILDNENNTGTFVWNDIRLEKALEPIIDIETFVKVQARRKIKAKLGGRAHNNNFLLSGLLRCSECKGSLTGHTSNKGKYVYRYYVCTNYVTKGVSFCSGGWYRADAMEDTIMESIEALMQNKGLSVDHQLIPTDLEDLHESVRLKISEFERTKVMMDRAAAAYEAGEYDLDFFRQRKAKLEGQKKDILSEIENLKAQVEKRLSSEELMVRLTAKSNEFSKILKETDPNKIKARLQGLIDHIEVRAVDEMTVYYRV